MAGGIGSRFWPMSCEDKPKQFIDIMSVGRTFIQQTFDRFKTITPVENFVVVTSSKYKDLVLEQLPELDESQVLCEPMRRNTAPCIAYAAYNILAKNPEATMVVTPSDHLILKQDEFEAVISNAMDIASKEDMLITIGIKPSTPETGYGYIQVDSKHSEEVSKVKTFTEKPNLELAKVFVESGEFFWNSGIFIWSLRSIMKALNIFLPGVTALFEKGLDLYNTPAEREFVENIYPECQNISIDYGIMEHASNVLMAHADFGWSDVGTWGSLYNMGEKDSKGNIINAKKAVVSNVSNSVIGIEDGKEAIIEGLDNHIVILANDKLLVFSKDKEQVIKNYVEELKSL